MRWTNYFVHPGDNRYHVFAFPILEHADNFEDRLHKASIPFERHLESADGDATGRDEWLFGIHRDHFQGALHENHLVHATYRSKFIPVDGFRWSLLIGTLAVVLIAIIGALTQRANAQTDGWQIAASSTWMAPLVVLGAEPISHEDEGLSLTWTPTGGISFGMRLLRRFPSSWSVETGLETMRTWSDWDLEFQPSNSPLSLYDTLTLRTARYRMPLLARTHVPINNRSNLTAAAGISIDYLVSDAFTTGTQSHDEVYSDYMVEENRLHRFTFPLRAEIGYEFLPLKKDQLGFYVGAMWWRDWNQNRWGEATWTRELETADVRIFMAQAAFAFEFRIILP